MEGFEYFILVLVVLIIGIIIIKKITGCIFRLVIGFVLLGILAWCAHQIGWF